MVFKRQALFAMLLVVVCGGLSLGAAGPAPAQEKGSAEKREQLEPLRKQLRAHGYAADAAGLRAYIADFQANDEDVRQLDEWIELLGAPHYRVRETAMLSLLNRATTQPQLVNHRLRQALEVRDQEVRFRARWILARSSTAGAELLTAALRLIAAEPVEGLAAELLHVWPYCASEHQRSSFNEALKATSRVDDQELLASLARSPEKLAQTSEKHRHLLQVAAIEALRHVLDKQCVEMLSPYLRHDHEQVRLATAVALIDFDPLPAIETLIELLASDDPQVGDRALIVLRHVSGQDIWVNAYGDRAERIAGVEQWKQWYATHGKTTQWRLPLAGAEMKHQRLLLAMFRPNRVLHCTLAGERLDEATEVSTPSGCAMRANGNRLVAEWAANSLCEITAEGKLVARHNLGANPNGMELLPNGNVLVALFNGNQVMEVSPAGKKLWTVEVDRSPTDVRRLPNGNTLVALHGSQRLVELNSKQQVVWSIGGLPSPEAARPLANGNILVVGDKGVQEYNRQGRVVWDLNYPRSAYDAVYLDNGNVVVADKQDGVFEYTRAGKELRKITDGCARRIHYY